jgi:cytochrome c-type biogenesis protein CcmE
MSSLHKKRLFVVVFMIGGLGLAAGLILFALSKNIDLFYSPSQLAETTLPYQKSIRVGGMVVKDSVKRDQDLNVTFTLTDFEREVIVHYQGMLPDLFREGQGVVALGKVNMNGEFYATQILAKHDEKYMPPEVAGTLKAKT